MQTCVFKLKKTLKRSSGEVPDSGRNVIKKWSCTSRSGTSLASSRLAQMVAAFAIWMVSWPSKSCMSNSSMDRMADFFEKTLRFPSKRSLSTL